MINMRSRREILSASFSAASSTASKRCGYATGTCCSVRSGIGRCFSPFSFAFIAATFFLVPYLGRNFFPSVDFGPDPDARARATSARGSKRAPEFCGVEKAIRDIIPPKIWAPWSTTSGSRQRHQHVVQQHRHYRRAGWRHPDRVKSGPPPDARVCQPVARQASREVSRHDFLIPAGRYHQPNSEFRRADANRSADPWPETRPTSITRRSFCAKFSLIPGVADARIQQSRESPGFKVNVDRSRAQYVGVTNAT